MQPLSSDFDINPLS